ncbi:Unknown protein, partial [Striga hermonthica]
AQHPSRRSCTTLTMPDCSLFVPSLLPSRAHHPSASLLPCPATRVIPDASASPRRPRSPSVRPRHARQRPSVDSSHAHVTPAPDAHSRES